MNLDIINPNFSAWVDASAGTGKTKILIDRVLRLLLENKKNILCLTLTNAAANEMENRVHSILSRWATCSNDELIISLKQLGLSLPSSKYHYTSPYHSMLLQCSIPKSEENEAFTHYIIQARKLFSRLENLTLTIQTIHSFCYKLIYNFSIEVGMAPNYILSEYKELHSIAFEKTLHSKAVQGSICSIATEIDENKLRDLLYTLYIKRLSLTTDLEYIKNKLNAPNKICDLGNGIIEHIERLVEILNKGNKRDRSYSAILSHWCNDAKKLAIQVANNTEIKKESINSRVAYWSIKIESLAKVFLKSESYKKKSISSLITKSISDKFKDAKWIIENIQNIVLSHIRDINSYKIFKRTSNLLNIFKIYSNLYKNEKLKNAFLDYNDIIDLATNILSNPEYNNLILSSLDQKIDHILVDEAQDNSTSQWKIIMNLYDKFFISSEEKRTLFVVGDIKQSIYRFQGANPYLFNYMKKYFHTKSGNKNWISCRLEKSFRSVPEILSFIDKIFGNLRKEISFIDNEIKHIPHRKNDQGYIEIWPLLPRYKEEEQQPLQINLINRKHYIIPDRLLAQAIAHRIHTWLSKGRILVTKDRHMEPGDIMILIRQRNMLVDYLISELKKVSVPVIGRDSFRIMDYIVVQDLIALAEFLLLPTNDLALANVLKSPLFNFTEDDLFNISYNRKEQSLWERLQNYSFVIYSELDYLINLSHTESLLTLFTHVIYTGKKKFIARLGLECSEVLDEFINLVLQFENLSLQGFIQWIKENNPEIKNDMQTHYNAVRIMTIHKSKGLQSPIVFLADTNTIPKNNESIIFDAMEAPFWCERNTNVYCDQIKRKKKLEDYNEYLRLLYVALTRAEDELYILGKEPVQKGSWYDLIANNQELYEKKQSWLQPIFKEKVEISCVNVHYPFIYKQLDHFDIPVVSFPPNLTTLFQKAREKKTYWISTLSTWNNKQEKIEANNYRKGLIIHNILQYMPKIEKNRRESWIKEYLNNINLRKEKDEIYSKILAFNEKYNYLFDLEGKSEVTLSGMIDGKPVLVRLDRLCITQDKAIIIDYKSHINISISSLDEIKKQMYTYKTLVQGIYPNKQVECIVVWIENLSIQSDF